MFIYIDRNGSCLLRNLALILLITFVNALLFSEALAGESTSLIIPRQTSNEDFIRYMGDRRDWTDILFECCSFIDANDGWFDLISECEQLVNFQADVYPGNHLSADAIPKLLACRNLRRLSLEHGIPLVLSDVFVSKMITYWPKLESLRLSNSKTPLTQSGIRILAQQPNLRTIHLWVDSNVGDVEISLFAMNRPELYLFNLPGSKQVTGHGLKALAQFPKLTSISLGLTPNSADEGLIAIGKNCENLEVLILEGGEATTDTGVKGLAGLQKLHTFTIYSTKITDAGLSVLGDLPRLFNIDLNKANTLTDMGLINFFNKKTTQEQLPGNLFLNFSAAKLTDISLKAARKLQGFSANAATSVTDDGIIALCRNNPDLRILNLKSATMPSDKSLVAMAELKDIAWIDLRSAKNITQNGVENLIKKHPGIQILTRFDQ